MPAQYLAVYDKIGRPVEAKTLVDSMGLDVINPRTGSDPPTLKAGGLPLVERYFLEK